MRDMNKTYHICPTYDGGRDWPFSAYSPQTNVMYVQLQNLCADMKVRTDNIPSLPQQPVQHGRPTTMHRRRQDQYRPHRRHQCGNRQDGVELGNAGVQLFADPGDGGRAGLQWRHGPLFPRPGPGRRQGAVADAAGLAGVRRAGHLQRQGPAIYRRGRAAAASMAARRPLAPGIDQPAGDNMVYVFALPE